MVHSTLIEKIYENGQLYKQNIDLTVILGPLRGNLQKKTSIFKDIIQIGGREVNPI